jgi:PAS domain-containing protein
LPGGAGYGLVGLALLAAGLLVWSLVLRRRVAARTQALQAARAELEGLRAAGEEARLRLDAETAGRIRELDDTAAEFRAIVEAASSGIVLMRDRHIVHCNRRMDEIFGYAPGEQIGQPTRIWYASDEEWARVGEEVYRKIWQGENHQREAQAGARTAARCGCGCPGGRSTPPTRSGPGRHHRGHHPGAGDARGGPAGGRWPRTPPA